ncbi:MAG TPA: hypothetical protein VEI07_18980 [Planctomycetaceae bacterium]|nr:hypothetical protein [Planctomycetaceae bacterium]
MAITISQLNLRASLRFLLATMLTIVWIAVSAQFPDFSPGGIPIGVSLIVLCNGILLFGLWRGLARADFPAAERATMWLALGLPLALWIALIWGLAVHGTFGPMPGTTRIVPALPLAIFLPVILGTGLLCNSKRIGALLDATPPSWLIGLQVYRVLGAVFLVDWAQGRMPGAFAIPAGIGDVAVGLLALPTALWVSSGRPIGRNAGVWWNMLGLADLAVAIAMGMMTFPGRFQLLALDHPNAQIGTFPTVMIPAFAVPNSILLHALSLRQLRRLGKTASRVNAIEQAGLLERVPESA